jgi:hypothetical protein
MRSLRLLALLSGLTASIALVAMACGEDEAIVRPRLFDPDATVTNDGAATGEGGTLGCGVTIPATYESPAFAANAAVELALASHVQQIADKMRTAEGTSTMLVTAAELKDLFGQGTPSLRAVSTPAAQSALDGYFDAFGAAGGKTWTPNDAEQDGGLGGGKYKGTFYFSATGVDLREAADKTLLGGVLYNHVLGIIAQQITNEASIDRLLAAFGASTALSNRADLDGSVDEDRLIAGYAARRDSSTNPDWPGPYRQIKTALLTMKAAVPAGEKCKADLELAVKTYLTEWERTTYASAIFYLNAAAVSAADPEKGPLALRAYGQALGFIQSFRGLPQEKRKISDSQIDALTTKIGATTPFKLVTSPGSRVLSLNEAISDIALYEGFTTTEVENFRK